jgi:hypothetical protein
LVFFVRPSRVVQAVGSVEMGLSEDGNSH